MPVDRSAQAGTDQPRPLPGGRLAAALERRRTARLAAAALLTPRRVDPSFAHVSLRDPSACSRCPDRCCTYLCPAGVFTWDAPAAPAVRYERCVECGACNLFCPRDNVELTTPRGGFGIHHRFG